MRGRVWTYTISKELGEAQIQQLVKAGNEFVRSWTTHEQQLHGSFEVFRKRIIVVKVDEEVNGASGCSIDKLNRFVKESEKNFGVELMNRLLVAIKSKDGIMVTHSSRIPDLLKEKAITEDTLVYNTSVSDSEELSRWEQPLKESWLKKYL